jgi:hypothetical protein
MANEIDTGVGSGVLYENISQAAQYVFNENAMLRNLVTVYDMTGTPGLTASIPLWPKASAVTALAAGADLSNDSALASVTAIDITAAEYGNMATIQDIVIEASPSDVGADVGRQLGAALAQAMDQSVVDLFTSFTASKGPGAGSELTVEHILAAGATLRAASVPMTGLVAVLHPFAAYNLKKGFLNAGGSFGASPDLANTVAREYFVGRIGGIDIYESASIDIDSGDDAIGAVFHPAAIGMTLKRDIRIALQRDESLRGFEVVASAAWGASIIDNVKGVKLISDAAI